MCDVIEVISLKERLLNFSNGGRNKTTSNNKHLLQRMLTLALTSRGCEINFLQIYFSHS